MKQKIIYILIALTVYVKSWSQERMTGEEYIEAYSEIAIREMERSGIPASITLAQGMLESDNGNSRLATEARNHFGIKCHNDWNGKSIKHDDDHRKECFRKYDSVLDSYRDHSDFLMTGSRYAELFELDPLDYKGWARGLKRTGYATSNTYAAKLIKIIEENDLHKFDLAAGQVAKNERKVKRTVTKPDTSRVIHKRNRINYIVVREGDTYESLRKEMGLMPFELFRYNNITRDSLLYPGRELYIQPKRNQAEAGKLYHTVKKGENLYMISQMYGVKPERLMQMNLMASDTGLVEGQRIALRKKVAGRQERQVRQSDQTDRETDKKNEKPKFKAVKKIKEKVKDKEEETLEFEFNQ